MTSTIRRWAILLVALATALALVPMTFVAGDDTAAGGVETADGVDVADATTAGSTSTADDGVRPEDRASERARDRRPPHAGPPEDPGPPTDDPDDGPTDYIAMADQLSQPVYGDDDLVHETFTIELHDGEEMYVEVTMPDPAFADEVGGFPVVLKAGPYNGTLLDRRGWRIFPDPRDEDGEPVGLRGYFAPRGYAVAIADLRGTGRSSGCLDHLGQNDAKDLVTLVEWLADAEWSNGRVGMTGHSYPGSTPSIAAAQNPRGLVTIAPSAGLASMYDHQFQRGVKWFLQYAGPQWAYATIATNRDLPPTFYGPLGETGDNFPTDNPHQVGCGWTTSAGTAGHGQVTGQYQAWHAQRDWRQAAADVDIPIFMIHGVNDNAARITAAEWFFAGRTGVEGDKVWLSQHDHGSANATTCEDADGYGHVNCRFDQWKYALHAWFDHHLMQTGVDTGQPVEVFLNDDRETGEGQVWTADRWDAPEAGLTLYPDARDMSLSFTEPDGAASASWVAHGNTKWLPGAGWHSDGTKIDFVSDPLAEDLLLVGPPPRMKLDTSVATSQHLNVVVVVEREDADGERHPLNHCAIQAALRHGVATPAPIVPGEVMDLDLQCFTMAHHLTAGERLVLSVRTWSDHHVSDLSNDARVTVHTGPGASAWTTPVIPDFTLHEDVEVHEDGVAPADVE